MKKSSVLFAFVLAICTQSSNAVGGILHTAVGKSDISELRSLLSNIHIRKLIDTPELQNGWTPLHLAIIQECVSCGKILLNYGASPNIQDYLGKTPFAYALAIPDPQIRGLIIYRMLEVQWNQK